MKKQFVRPQIKATCTYRVANGTANQNSPVHCTVLPNQNGPATCTKY